MARSHCTNCNERPARDGYTECFRCHIGGIRFGFVGGQAQFHDSTNKERGDDAEKHVNIARAEGRDIERLSEKATW